MTQDMTVYVIIIQTEQMDLNVGAVYASREVAEAECVRLKEANPHTDAYFVIRQVG